MVKIMLIKLRRFFAPARVLIISPIGLICIVGLCYLVFGTPSIQANLSVIAFTKSPFMPIKGVSLQDHFDQVDYSVDFSQTTSFQLDLNHQAAFTMKVVNSNDTTGQKHMFSQLLNTHGQTIKSSYTPESNFAMMLFPDGSWQEMVGLGYGLKSSALYSIQVLTNQQITVGVNNTTIVPNQYTISVVRYKNFLPQTAFLNTYGLSSLDLVASNDTSRKLEYHQTMLSRPVTHIPVNSKENWARASAKTMPVSMQYPPDFGLANYFDHKVVDPPEFAVTSGYKNPQGEVIKGKVLTLQINTKDSLISTMCFSYEECLKLYQDKDPRYTYFTQKIAGEDGFGIKAVSASNTKNHESVYAVIFKKGADIWSISERIGGYSGIEEERMDKEFFDIVSTVSVGN
jgi:hypothetical protein